MASLLIGLCDRPACAAADLRTRSRRQAVRAAAGRLVLVWLAVRTVAWTALMTARANPPLDLVEWLSWGRQWRLGYHKHPPLAAWVAETAWWLTPGSFFGVYLAGYLAVALALWCAWNVARQVLPLRAALAATLSLEGVVFLGAGAGEFNNQVLLVGFWALLVDRAFAAWRGDRLRDWVLAGAALGLALLCKYSVALLVAPLLAWWFWQEGLRRLSRLGIVAAVSGLIFLPHLVWLWHNDWVTLHYASRRAHGDPGAPGTVLSLGSFLLSQANRLAPMLVVLAAVLGRRRRLEAEPAVRSFILAAALGPIGLHLLLGLVPGSRLRGVWGMPLYTFAPAAILLACGANQTGRAWQRFRLTWAGVGLAALGLVGLIQVAGWPALAAPRRVEFPGRALAEEVSRRYAGRHGRPPGVAAGDWWLAGNVSCLAPGRPVLYSSREPAHAGLDVRHVVGDPRRFCSPEPETAPWTGDADLARRGGVLLWCADAYGDGVPDWLQDRFPTAEGQPVLELPWASGRLGVRVGWAMLPPATE